MRAVCVFCGASEGARPTGDGLRAVIDHAVRERFVSPDYAGLLLLADTPTDLLDRLAACRAPEILRA